MSPYPLVLGPPLLSWLPPWLPARSSLHSSQNRLVEAQVWPRHLLPKNPTLAPRLPGDKVGAPWAALKAFWDPALLTSCCIPLGTPWLQSLGFAVWPHLQTPSRASALTSSASDRLLLLQDSAERSPFSTSLHPPSGGPFLWASSALCSFSPTRGAVSPFSSSEALCLEDPGCCGRTRLMATRRAGVGGHAVCPATQGAGLYSWLMPGVLSRAPRVRCWDKADVVVMCHLDCPGPEVSHVRREPRVTAKAVWLSAPAIFHASCHQPGHSKMAGDRAQRGVPTLEELWPR